MPAQLSAKYGSTPCGISLLFILIRRKVAEYINRIDVGILDLIVENEPTRTKKGDIKEIPVVKTIHEVYDASGSKTGTKVFNLRQESTGTLRFLSFIQRILLLLENGTQISRRNVDYLYRSFEYLIKCSLPSRLKELAPVFKKNCGIIISVDGLQPQQGNDLLYVIRDVETQEVLHGVILHNTDTEAMVKLFRIIKDSGMPVKEIVSDGQHSIRKAKDLVFPGVPYQLCTFHYLKDMVKVVGKKDSEIRVGLKKLRGLRPIERLIAEEDKDTQDVLNGYAQAIRTAWNSKGHSPWNQEESSPLNCVKRYMNT